MEWPTWEKVFIENGADIILGDHTHSVQPTKIVEHNGKNIFVAYSPGNYTNIYQEHDGDACILTHTYIDKETKEIIGEDDFVEDMQNEEIEVIPNYVVEDQVEEPVYVPEVEVEEMPTDIPYEEEIEVEIDLDKLLAEYKIELKKTIDRRMISLIDESTPLNEIDRIKESIESSSRLLTIKANPKFEILMERGLI